MTTRNSLTPGVPVSGVVPGGPVAYTPTVTWTNQTLTTQSGAYLKTPGKLEIWVSVNVSVSGAAGAVTISLPTGYTAVTLAGSLACGVGTWGGQTAGAVVTLPVFAAAGATTQIASTGTGVPGTTGTHGGYFNIPTTT